MHSGLISHIIDGLVVFGSNVLLPFMGFMFITAIAARTLLYYTVKREEWFVNEFEKRMVHYLEHEKPSGPLSFYGVLKRLLEKTFYELFEQRGLMRRSRVDNILSPSDRIFLIQQGSAYLVRDSLKRAGQIKRTDEGFEELGDMAGDVLGKNPAFSRVLGLLPVGTVNDFVSQLPGLFVVGGIFGTFLGIMRALPELGGMDLNDPVGTKTVMDQFLMEVAFSMSTSVMGIFFSICSQSYNAFLNPERKFAEVVDKYHHVLTHLWRRTDTNEIPSMNTPFDEHKDPQVALAEISVQKELAAADGKKKNGHHGGGQQPPAMGKAA